MKKQVDDDELEIVKKAQNRVRREFNFLVESTNMEYDFSLAQAKEICGYLNRVSLTPFRAWEHFIKSCIDRDEESFFNTFYLKRNEYGVLEPDIQRIGRCDFD